MRLKRKHRGYGDTFFIGEVFAGVPEHKINRKQHYLWRAVDQEGSACSWHMKVVNYPRRYDAERHPLERETWLNSWRESIATREYRFILSEITKG